MEISGIDSEYAFLLQGRGKIGAENIQQNIGDVVSVQAPAIMSDEEAGKVFNDTLDMIGLDGAAALSVHSGLKAGRVYALLGM